QGVPQRLLDQVCDAHDRLARPSTPSADRRLVRPSVKSQSLRSGLIRRLGDGGGHHQMDSSMLSSDSWSMTRWSGFGSLSGESGILDTKLITFPAALSASLGANFMRSLRNSP